MVKQLHARLEEGGKPPEIQQTQKAKSGHKWQIPDVVFAADMSSNSKLIYAIIRECPDVRMDQISTEIGLSKRHVSTLINDLERRGYIKVNRELGLNHEYECLVS